MLLTWVPPQSSELNVPIWTTRTTSPYFSPNRAIAPVFFASSIDISFVTTSRPAAISRFTISSTFAISSSVIGEKCVKSKRSLSLSTNEPFCSTWLPSTSRSACCIKWVALWLFAVRFLCSSSTVSFTVSPFLITPFVTRPTCPIFVPWSLMTSSTTNVPSVPSITPASATWPPIVAYIGVSSTRIVPSSPSFSSSTIASLVVKTVTFDSCIKRS